MCDYSKLYLPARSRITRMNFKFSEHNRQLHMVGFHAISIYQPNEMFSIITHSSDVSLLIQSHFLFNNFASIIHNLSIILHN
jgi:hypothetical protein